VNWLIQRTLNPPAQDAATFATYMDAQRQFRDVRRRLVVVRDARTGRASRHRFPR